MNHVLLGNHPAINKIRELITLVSDTALNVLILGETGTGKEVVARHLHNGSNRRNKKFIKVNCSSIPFNLLESELFGYEKGAFTGAERNKPGKFELASDGVIFLDEIGDMPYFFQVKLLQVLQSGEFIRLGGTKEIKVNSWVISATNHDLARDLQEGKFREDLYYRLNIIKIEIPPLRERRDDIPLLTEHFVQKYCSEFQISAPFTLSQNLKELLQIYHWPGNVRELSSVILKLMIGNDPQIVISELVEGMRTNGHTPHIDITSEAGLIEDKQNEVKNNNEEATTIRPLKDLKIEASKAIEKKVIQHVLNMTGWNKREAARILKISYKALFYKIADLGIETGSGLL